MSTHPNPQPRLDHRLIGIMVLVVCAVALYGGRDLWIPQFHRAVAYLKNESPGEAVEHTSDMFTHDSDDTGHVAHDDSGGDGNPDSIKLTREAWANIGLITGTVEASDFVPTKNVPAMVVERPGRSLVHVPAPVTGVVTKVLAVERDSVQPGQPLFELRLTHEDVVTAQTNFLEHLHHQATQKKELERLQAIGSEIIAGNRIIAQQYKYEEESERVEGLRQSLLLHGLSPSQIATIEAKRALLRTVTVVAPPFADSEVGSNSAYHLRKLEVSRGAIVEAGHRLAVLADHSLLFVEGQAFEDDAQSLFQTAAQETKIKVTPFYASDASKDPLELTVHSVADQVDPVSRSLKFYLLLPNEKITDKISNDSFVCWKYRPGQRMEVALRTDEVFKNNFVLPAEAVVIDGPNSFVFEQNGDHFDRVDVSVLYRDRNSIVVKRDVRLVGSVIAMTAAFDMHLALKNSAAGPVDPHAGHTH